MWVSIESVRGVSPRVQRERCDGKMASLISEANTQVRVLCAHLPRCTYLAHSVAADIGSGQSFALHDRDGFHPSKRGYELLLGAVRTALTDTPAAYRQHATARR